MIRITLVIATISASLLFSSCSSSKEVTNVDVPITTDSKYAFDFIDVKDLDAALQQAKKEKKLVFVDVFASWCLPCKMMDEDVFTHEQTADMINADFISYKVNAEKGSGPALADQYMVRSYPTLLFLDSNGNLLERKEGAAYHRELLELAASAKAKAPALTMN